MNGDLTTSQIPAATAQAQADAVAVAQQHRQPVFPDSTTFTQAVPMQPLNNYSSQQETPMTSPPQPGSMSPHLQVQVPSASVPQVQTTHSVASAPVMQAQATNQMSPSGQMLTPPRSQGKTPPHESGKSLGKAISQAQSPASQTSQSSLTGKSSATESKPNLQMLVGKVPSGPPTPPSSQPQKGKSKVCPLPILPVYCIICVPLL